MHPWTIEFYANKSGKCYLDDEFISKINTKNRLLLERLFKKIEYFLKKDTNELQRSNDMEDIGDELWELKFHLMAEIRFIGSFSENIFYVFIGFIKKDQKIKSKYIKLAKERLREFKKTNNIK